MPITVWIKQQIQSKYFKAGNQHQNFKACFWHVFLQKYIGSPSTNHRGSNDDVIKMAAIIQSYKLLCISGTIYPIVLISTPNHTISTSSYHLVTSIYSQTDTILFLLWKSKMADIHSYTLHHKPPRMGGTTFLYLFSLLPPSRGYHIAP